MRPVEISKILDKIKPLNEEAAKECKDRWNSLAKPLNGMGGLEEAVIRIAAAVGSARISLDKKVLIVMCADNGVVCEGVSQSGPDVTKKVSDNFFSGKTSACLMARKAGADVWAVDIGVCADTLIENKKIARGTENIAEGPAMSRKQAAQAIETGIDKAFLAKKNGYKIIAAGEMGIANTTTSAAVASVLAGIRPEEAAGRGAGLCSASLENKIRVIKKAVSVNNPDKSDPVDVLSKLGGFDLCGMCGLFIGAAACALPIVIDGFISSVAALCAAKIDSRTRDFMLASHKSKEPAAGAVLNALGLKPYLDLGMHLGEGTGALCLFTLLDMALAVYNGMPTFEEAEIEQYKEYES